jgi:hypothetical protein
MKIDKKETTLLIALGLGLLYLKNNNHDISMNDVTDENDKGLIIFVGALALFFLM